jgi:hypothetical protein
MYDEIATLYHLVYPDWNAAIAQQASALDAVIRQHVSARLRGRSSTSHAGSVLKPLGWLRSGMRSRLPIYRRRP